MSPRKSAGQRVGVRSAAIYARISSDAEGTGLGVARQLEDCRRLAADRGWPVGAEYVDNDVSAFSGKLRQQYARMLADLESGDRDAVIVYNLDRLHRRPVELEEFVTLCESVGVRDVATVTADIDLGNDDGLFMARIFRGVRRQGVGSQVGACPAEDVAERPSGVAARFSTAVRLRGRQDHRA